MGEFYVDIDVCSKSGAGAKPLRVKVNTGAKYTVLPSGLLRKLGWEPEPAEPMPWGWPIELFYDVDPEAHKLTPLPDVKVGEVKLRIGDQDYPHSVIYGADDSQPVLGSWTVRGFVFDADEPNQRVIPSQLIYR
ncbi:hypothetical protein GBAR_LOCUS6596 [Geodia barretti]|uniref:Uncharacterized protein n=1 Tax=Geodia barretti TaxID=519541 RepID=A0AA35W791_GEOBA|nr:hypothetical protein GBAR_LOCUS6596 [Geodia barretti]